MPAIVSNSGLCGWKLGAEKRKAGGRIFYAPVAKDW